MANILLISGAVSGKKRYGKLDKVGAYLPPYGLLSIAAVLENAGHSVELIDREVSNISNEAILALVGQKMPDIVGMSVFTIGLNEAICLARQIKETHGLTIIAGGPHVFVGPEYLMETPWFDYLVVGEGEITIRELVHALTNGEKVDEIDGIFFRRDGEWLRSPKRTHILNLDELPFPAFHLLDNIKRYHPAPFGYRRVPHFTIVTSRGCPFDCVFCSAIWGHQWRAHSANYVLEMVKNLYGRFGAREIWFAEDTFAIDRQRVVDLCEGLIRENLNLIWSCMTNLHVLDEELLTLMKRAGCWQIQLGLESGSDDVLKFVRKPIRTKMVREKINIIDKVGIKVRGYFILGHLIDTRETIQQTIEFAMSLPLYTAEFHILHLPLGSRAREIAHDYGKVDYDLSLLTGYTHSGLSFVPDGLTEKEMFEFRRIGHNRFFLRPQQIWTYLKDIQCVTDLKRYGLIGQAFIRNIL